MRRIALTASAAAIALTLVVSLQSAGAQQGVIVPRKAAGDGTMFFAVHDGKPTNAGYFTFNVTRGSSTGGTITFAAEAHEEYPEIIIVVPRIEYATFSAQTVHFAGNGRIQFVPAFVTVTAFDGAGERPDRLAIVATNDQGEILFHAAGEVGIGDLYIGERR